MIPKKIHYFWFSGDPFPENIKRCMESWEKVMPDYEIIKWDLNNTPIEGAFAQKALAEKKWAFLSDYARLRILHEHGGIYMDTDVLLVKPFDDLLCLESFWGTDEKGMIEPIVIGAKPQNEVVKACMDVYLSKKESTFSYKAIPLEILPVFERKGYNNEIRQKQIIDNACVFPFDYFCPMPFEKADTKNPLEFSTSNTYAIHLWNAAWFDPFRFFWNGRKKAGWKSVWKEIRKNPRQSFEFYKNVGYHLKCVIFGYHKLNKK